MLQMEVCHLQMMKKPLRVLESVESTDLLSTCLGALQNCTYTRISYHVLVDDIREQVWFSSV
uniref:Uncharacterized protein n=1 Tax=Arundo donax TaxID=35708 RepID=A0A0A9EXY6_ARUDO